MKITDVGLKKQQLLLAEIHHAFKTHVITFRPNIDESVVSIYTVN
jgi:hypothetical protein